MKEAADNLRVTVIIPTYGRRESLLRCLAGLAEGERRPQETLVVVHEQDPQAQGLEAEVAPYREVLGLRLVWSARAGQIHQMNAGLAEAKGDLICFTDDDCVPRRDWLQRLSAPYADPRVGGVGGRDVVHQGNGISGGPGRRVGRVSLWGRVIGNHHLEFPPGPVEVEHLKGANMSFRRAAVLPLDPNMALGTGSGSFNDTDLSLAVRARGYRLIYDPQALVDHYPAPRHGATHRDARHPEQVYLDSHNWAYLIFKHSSWGRRLAFLLYAFGVGCGNRLGLVKYLSLVWRQPRAATQQWWTTCRGLLAGIRDYRRAPYCATSDTIRQESGAPERETIG